MNVSVPETIAVTWTQYRNFFELWRAHKSTTEMIYVIGEQHHCYVGAVGCDGGSGAMSRRYQWQYVRLAMSIFGLDEAAGQVAYAAIFDAPDLVRAEDIYEAEAFVQQALVSKVGRENVFFRPIEIGNGAVVVSSGDVPSFLR